MVWLRQLLLLTRDVRASARFFGEQGLGLRVLNASDDFARLVEPQVPQDDVNARTLLLQRVEKEAECSTGYSPILQFDVQDMDLVIQNLLMQGGRLDGPIKYPVEGRIAALRSPDGHMIGLFEPNPELAKV
jgi:hypothetical protein